MAISPQPKAIPEKNHSPDMAELLLTSEFDPIENKTGTEDDSFPFYGQEEDNSDFNVSVCNDVDMLPDSE